ncbi:MAG: hypothetical protein Q9208_006787 [Pyrenodesmia sp. 3 TL-2023]
MTFPRENNLVRFYIQLPDEGANGKQDRSETTIESILKTAQRILAPYTLEYAICDWWSVYSIGQRLAPQFDVNQRIFLAGDSVHTHSPKAGQGMNVSMQDTYNLTWKICLVIHGLAHPRILSTYHSERHGVAQKLIAMDQELAKFYSAVDDPRRTDYQTFRDKYSDFICGVGVRYGESCLVDPTCEKFGGGPMQQAAVEVGMRIPSIKLINHASAEPTHLHALLPSNGAFRIVIFAGTLASCSDRLKLVNGLAPRFKALVSRYNKALRPPLVNGSHNTARTPLRHRSRQANNLLEILVLHTGTRDGLALLDLDEVYHPWDNELGWDYGRVFIENKNSDHCAVDGNFPEQVQNQACMAVIVRPDQHVGAICEMSEEGLVRVEKYFAGILTE